MVAMCKILVIEDDKESVSWYKHILSDYAVDYVGTVNDAFSKLRETAYDLIIADLMLPGGSGFDVVKAGYKNVIIITALNIDPADMYTDVEIIRKPFLASDFINKVKNKIAKWA